MEKESLLHSKLLHFLILLNSPAHAGEFLYPLCCDPHYDLVYLMYQKTPTHIELWGWCPTTQQAEQLLFPRLTPAGFQLLPDGQTYSFIDQGTLKIKQRLKRSPRTVAFEAPLYNVELVHWINKTTFYSHGRYHERFMVFQGTVDGDIYPLLFDDAHDYLYPQKVDDTIFVIERDSQWHYRIVKIPYVWQPELTRFEERLQWYSEHKPLLGLVADFADRPIVFLRMVNEHEGFMLEHSKTMSRRDQTVEFVYHHMRRSDAGDWKVSALFAFQIPSRFLFLDKEDRLYEALLPLLPRHVGTQILYADAVSKDLGLFVYEQETKKSFPCLVSKGESFFVPIVYRETLLFGGSLGGAHISMEPNDFGVRVMLGRIEGR